MYSPTVFAKNLCCVYANVILINMSIVLLNRGEVKSFVQKLLDKKSSRKKKKYDGILSFSRQFEFIYVETATTSVFSKSDNDLSKLHNAIILMFKHMVSTLPEKLLHEIFPIENL